MSLEYYFERVGVLSASVFRRNIKNFFGSTVFPSTPEFLALYDLDPAVYGKYDVSTQYNVAATTRMQGLELNYKQALTFLPDWARGVQVFSNASFLKSTTSTGDRRANFNGYIPRTVNFGVSLSRDRFNVKFNWNSISRARSSYFTAGSGIEENTYTWTPSFILMDLYGEFRLNRNLSLFTNLRNLTNPPKDNQRYGPNTPNYARNVNRVMTNAAWTIGIKGTF